MHRSLRTAAAFSLIELVVTLAISSVAVTLVATVMVTSNRSMQTQENVRLAQDSMRSALNLIEPAVRRASFGLNPAMAFDFDGYAAKPCAGTATVCPRDLVDGTDKLVFYARNQRYSLSAPLQGNAWYYQGNSGGIQLSARTGDRFRKGQLLYVVCSSVSDSAVVTVGDNVNVAANGTVAVSLESGTDRFHQQSRFAAAGCYGSGAGSSTLVFTIDRFHFFVNAYADSRGGATPWLMLDTGRDENGDSTIDASDYLPVAEGIEDFQVAYLMNAKTGYTQPDGNRDWIYGNVSSTAETPNPAIAAPAIDASMDDATRYTASPANIRGVRLTFTARAPLPGDAPARSADAPTAIENRASTSLPAIGRYRRFVFSSTIMTPNMEARRLTVF